MNDVRVYAVATFGSVVTGLDWFVNNLGPILDVFVRLGQIGVAAVTILYIYGKWKAMRSASKKDDNDDV